MKEKIKKLLVDTGDTITAVGTIIGLVLWILSLIISSIKWTPENVLTTVVNGFIEHRVFIWVSSLTLGTIYLALQFRKIRKQLTVAFNDDFKRPLDENWDYIGWKSSDGELTVTGSDQGGVTKKGTFWENYIFSFETKIIKGCIGVLIRAKDIQNYYMLQITHDKIRPHRKVTIPYATESPENKEIFFVDKIQVAWQVMDNIAVEHKKNLTSWFKVRVVVNGQSVKLFINSDQVFTNDLLLDNSYGKIGFRNTEKELALVRKVKIEIV